MSELTLTPEDLLAGSSLTFDVAVPSDILRPGTHGAREENARAGEMVVQLRPLSIGTFQLIMKATRNDMGLIPLLMIKESVIEPKLSLDQIKQFHLGLVEFLISRIRQISGLTEKKSP